MSRIGCVTRIQNVHLSESKRVVCWNASCRTHEWVTNFICKSATNSSQRNESKRVMSCIGMRHDAHMNASQTLYRNQSRTPLKEMSQNESCRVLECVITCRTNES